MSKKYHSYKDSGVEWLGEIPRSWKTGRLKHYFNLSSGKNSNDFDKESGQFPVYGSNGIIGYTNKPNLDKKTILIGRVGSSGKLNLNEFPCSVSDNCLIVELKGDNDLKFVYYVLIITKLENYTTKTSQPLITGSTIREIETILPSLHEQQQIVSYLDTKTSLIDSLVQKTQRKIELLKEKRTSLINEVVTKGLNPNVEMKDSGVEWIGEIPNCWMKTKMKYIVDIFGRIGYRGYTTEDIVDEGEGVITISPSNIFDDRFSTHNSTYLSWEKYHESPEIQIFTNDLILVKTGSTIGKTSIIPENVPEMTINPQLVVLKNIKISPKYLYYQTVCKFIKESFNIEQTGSSTPTISQEKVRDFSILKPTISEQNQIVEYLDEQTGLIDNTISTEKKRIELLKEYRQSLISEVVTGKLKVTTDE